MGGESSEANSVPVGIISPKLRKDTADGEGSQGAVQAGCNGLGGIHQKLLLMYVSQRLRAKPGVTLEITQSPHFTE